MFKFIILGLIFCLPIFLQADDQIQALDKQIAELKEEMHQAQLVEMEEEVDSQGLMIADWPAYGQEMTKIRKIELKIIELQKKINELEMRKKALIQQPKSKSTETHL